MKKLLLLSSLCLAHGSSFAYESTYDKIEWGQRGDDTNYCLDVTDEQGNIAYGLSAIACGEGLHEFYPRDFARQLLGTDLPDGFVFYWKIWSPSGYGQSGFEGQVVVGSGCQGLNYLSDAQTIQWGCRQDDVSYCVDIFDSNDNMVQQAVQCGSGLHSYSPASLNLAEGTYRWKISSASGYAGEGFEGEFSVGGSGSALTTGSQLYAEHCAACHGTDPSGNRDGIRSASSAASTRRAINKNEGGMGYLSFLTDADLENIAVYVASKDPFQNMRTSVDSSNSDSDSVTLAETQYDHDAYEHDHDHDEDHDEQHEYHDHDSDDYDDRDDD